VYATERQGKHINERFPQGKVLEKLISAQLLEKFLVFYEI
jgi:hypothetical protein